MQKSIYKSEIGKQEILSQYQRLLKDWGFPNRQKLIKTSYGETFIIEAGTKNDVHLVLLHGSSTNSAMWLDDITKYSQFYHVWAIDIPGECGLSAENRFPVSQFNNWMLEVFQELKIESAHLVGNSLGGWIATDFAIKQRSKALSLNTIASSGFVQMKFKTLILIIITSLLGDWGFRKFNKMVYGNTMLDEEVLDYAKTIQEYYKPRTDVLPIFKNIELAKINVPVTYWRGEHDCFFNSKKAANRITTNIKTSKTLIIKEKGHVLNNTYSQILNQINSKNGKH